MMADTGLISILADNITKIATSETLGFYSFLSGGLVNMFIPSGGCLLYTSPSPRDRG